MCATVKGQCLEYLVYITLQAHWKNLGTFYRAPFKSLLRVQIKQTYKSQQFTNLTNNNTNLVICKKSIKAQYWFDLFTNLFVLKHGYFLLTHQQKCNMTFDCIRHFSCQNPRGFGCTYLLPAPSSLELPYTAILLHS